MAFLSQHATMCDVSLHFLLWKLTMRNNIRKKLTIILRWLKQFYVASLSVSTSYQCYNTLKTCFTWSEECMSSVHYQHTFVLHIYQFGAGKGLHKEFCVHLSLLHLAPGCLGLPQSMVEGEPKRRTKQEAVSERGKYSLFQQNKKHCRGRNFKNTRHCKYITVRDCRTVVANDDMDLTLFKGNQGAHILKKWFIQDTCGNNRNPSVKHIQLANWLILTREWAPPKKENYRANTN